MRLLALEINGELSLTEFYGNNTPPYAILSHTWGEEGEEVTFKDIIEDTVKSKAGYNKIRFCGEQAVKDNLKYFWVDTCCIDKSSSSELLEAINSMFTWYRNATKCYVYLSDVSTCDYKENNHLSRSKWELSFRHSRWFTRGWTLQELIAPASVEFFSLEGERFGDKKLLERQVHDITGIPLKALQGIPLSSFSVPERMSWAAKRETKREEDRAYSLLGIYNIYMPLLYGEGSENAFIRLHEEIDKRSRKGEGQPNMPQPDPAFKAIQELLIDRKKRKEERIQSEARKAAEAARQAEATANNAAKLMAAEEKRWENEIAKKVRQAIEITKLDAEKEAAKKASEEIEEYEKKLEEAEKMIADLLVAKKKFEDEAKALRPKDDMLKPPIRFKDAVGRKFSYPWHICKTWKGMEALIQQSFLHVEGLGDKVNNGHYDLIGPDGEIILPQIWEPLVKPDMAISMKMWPILEHKKTSIAPPGYLLSDAERSRRAQRDLTDLLNGTVRLSNGEKKRRKPW